MRLGIDAAFAGTTVDFDLAADAGIEWVGEYFGGAGCYHVWTNADRQALATSKIPYRLPIWVPDQSFSSDPTIEANNAIEAFRLIGFKHVLGVDVEHGSGYTLDWGETWGHTLANAGIVPVMYHANDKTVFSTGASWLAFWTGNPPQNLEPRTAIQYRGATNSYNMSVDFDAAADDFPLEGLPVISSEGTNTVDTVNLPKGKLNAPIIAALSNRNGDGWWLFGSDGGVFCFGRATFHGSAAHLPLSAPIVSALLAPDEQGYTLVGSDGGTFRYGSGPAVPSLA